MCASASFTTRFGASRTRTFWAPARVNLIGEHIDYCGGAVLPMPLNCGTRVEIGARTDAVVRMFSTLQNDTITLDTPWVAQRAAFPRGHWAHYAIGVLSLLNEAGCNVAGADLLITADIPGSGLSSSASFCVALAMALSRCNGFELASLTLARVCRRVEHEFVGVQCGIMDQAVIVLGQPGAALYFDCAREAGHPVPLLEPRPAVLVIDSGRPRTLAHSAYNTRLQETRRAASSLGVPHTELALTDPQTLDRVTLDPIDHQRARHVISEHRRVNDTVRAIERGDWPGVGTLFNESHDSLRRLYEVSCAELDLLVELALTCSGVHGARMTGAGFGGALVVLVDSPQLDGVAEQVSRAYTRQTGIVCRSFVAESRGGATEIHD